jgi:hypothetical protein
MKSYAIQTPKFIFPPQFTVTNFILPFETPRAHPRASKCSGSDSQKEFHPETK